MSSLEPRTHQEDGLAMAPQPLEQQLRLQKSQEELLAWLDTLESGMVRERNLYRHIR
jgi:hypothetical protein